jgi:adenosylcobinamide amidohydrolase
MHLATYYEGVALFRRDKAIFGKFLTPHLVISTCRAAGGVQRDIDYVLNHQSCEPKNHQRDLNFRDAQGYRETICSAIDLPPQRCVTMGTAANMNHAAIVSRNFRGLEVIAVVTGGVEANGGRAGDPASVLETPDGFESLRNQKPAEIKPGTINIMVFISQPLTTAALTRVIITATEAKSAALQELAVNSRYSDGLATGTGTDQIIVAAPDPEPEDEIYRLTWAGKHSKLGELIGQAVKAGVKETLGKQNSLTPSGQCSAKIHMERFGCTRESMQEGICRHLPEHQATLLIDNFHGVNRDPLVVAGVATLAHLHDKFSWGILPPSCWKEVMIGTAAQLACSVGGNFNKMSRYRDDLAKTTNKTDNSSFLELCWLALAIGFSEKWTR